MNTIQNFITYYFEQLNQNPSNMEQFQNTILTFNNQFTQYVNSSIKGKEIGKLDTLSHKYDENNKFIYFNSFDLNPYLKFQPLIFIEPNDGSLSNLAFQITLKMNDSQESYFCYIDSDSHDNNFFLFSYLLHLSQYFLDKNTIPTFYNMIHFVNHEIQKNKKDNINNPNNSQQFMIQEYQDDDEEEEIEDKKKMLIEFVKKYTTIIKETYPEDMQKRMEIDKNNYFYNVSSFLQNNMINKTFKYNKFVETLQKYTTIFDSIHLDKQINFISHIFTNFTIRPILEFNFVKNIESIESLVNIEFIKFEISYFNKFLPDDKFDTVLTLVPYKTDKDFSLFLDLSIILGSFNLPLFDNPDNAEERLPGILLIPFMETLFTEWLNVVNLMKNPMLKRKMESQFLNDNQGYNERDLDDFIK